MSYDALTSQLHQPEKDTSTETKLEYNEGGHGAAESEEVMEELSPEQVLARRTLIAKARDYLRTFPTKLEDFANEERYPIDDLSLEELKLMIDEIRLSLGMRNSVGLITTGAVKAVAVVEHVAVNYTPLKVQGLTSILASNDEWNDCLKEIALESGGLEFLSPTKRLALITGMSVLQLHQLNSTVQPARNSEIKKEMEEKFAQL